jgi:RecB family endonuclease NucS
MLSYIGSLQAEEDRPVRGILVARGFSTRVRLAARAAGIRLVQYGYSFTFAVVGD